MKASVQEFRLPQADEEYIDRLGLSWRAILDSNNKWLIIEKWQIPDGYSHREAELALLIPTNYSDTQIDMAYFNPHISRSDGKPINSLSVVNIRAQNYQCWSRHRTAQNPWRPGEDDVASHLATVDYWLRREMEGR